MTNNFFNLLLQADGQIYNRSWIIWFVILIIVAGSWFTWHRSRKNIKKNKENGTPGQAGETIM